MPRQLKMFTAMLVIAGGLALAGVACNEDDADEIIDEILATNTPARTPVASATEGDPAGAEETIPAGGSELTSTEGGCEHGQGESTLFIIVRNLTPGETLTGEIVESPEGGLVEGTEFTGTADADGRASIPVRIRRFGTYRWSAAGESGEFIGQYTVEQECPGEPQ